MILSELLFPGDRRGWRLAKQCGVDEVFTLLEGGEQDQRMFASVGASQTAVSARDEPWSTGALRRLAEAYDQEGLRLVGVEDTPPLDLVRLNLPGRDRCVGQVETLLEAMAAVGARVLCYNWMALTSWARTDIAVRARGGALVTRYRAVDERSVGAIPAGRDVVHDQLWDGLEAFLADIVPVADELGITLAMHPDDPPLPSVRGVPRIMSSLESFERLLSFSASPANAVTFCQGNFRMMHPDVPTAIRRIGHDGRIAYVHFRDVEGRPDDFAETFHDDGPTDMAACLRAYEEVGVTGWMRSDHVPTMDGEDNRFPGYGTLGRLFAYGYIRGLLDARQSAG